MAEGLDERDPGGAQLDRPVHQAGGEGLQEHRVLRDDDIPQARVPGLLGPAGSIIRYPLETAKSLKYSGKAPLPRAQILHVGLSAGYVHRPFRATRD